MSTKFAIILSGCGRFDGSETKEAVLTLLAIDKMGAQYQCFAPNQPQLDVVNHLTGETAVGETRNMLEEAARIPHEPVLSIEEFDAQDFDALIFPGGFGAAKNLSSFAKDGVNAMVIPVVSSVIEAMLQMNKPIGFICIAPTMIPLFYPAGVKMTIGHDKDTAKVVAQMGAEHIDCLATNIVADDRYKVVSTPAYMVAKKVHEAAEGIEKLVEKLNDWAQS